MVKVKKKKDLEFPRGAQRGGMSQRETIASQQLPERDQQDGFLRRVTGLRRRRRFHFTAVSVIAFEGYVVTFQLAIERGAADAQHFACQRFVAVGLLENPEPGHPP